MLGKRTPQLFERSEPHAIVAAVASVVLLIAKHWLGFGVAATISTVACGFVLSLAAMLFH